MKLSEIAKIVGGEIIGGGGGEVEITGVASLRDALAGDISFLANKKYTPQLAATKASAALVSREYAGAPDAQQGAAALVLVDSPDAAFAQVVPLFAPPQPVFLPGVHPTAVIGEGVSLGEGVHVGAHAVIGDGAVIGAWTVVGANVVVGELAKIGENCRLHPLSSVRERCVLGKRVALHNGAVVGSDGYGYATKINADGSIEVEKIPQLGIVELGDDVEVGANTTIDRARFGATKIGRMTKIDNLVQIAHNVQIGECCGIVAQVGISGSTHIGDGVMVWGQAGLAGHLDIASGAEILAQSGVSKSLAKDVYFGTPAVDRREFIRQLHVPKKVDGHDKAIAALKQEIAELKQEIAQLKNT